MIRKLLITTVLTITVMGAASAQTNSDEWKAKYDSLQSEFEALKLKTAELEKVVVREYTKPLDYVKDWYGFYNRNYIYRGAKIRKLSENTFIVSLEEKYKKLEGWDAVIYYLTIDNGTYKMSTDYYGYDGILSQGAEGQLDERALYGKPGGGGGSSLGMAGWIWDFAPKPKDTSDETGRIVFEIKINDQGEIISVSTIESTVSRSVEQIYKKEVKKLTFSKTDNLPPAPQSTGRITFIIRSN